MEKYDAQRVRDIMLKIMQTDRLHRCAAEKFAKDMGIHRSQHRLLMYLVKNQDKVSQKDISNHFDISPAAVAKSLKKLESEGYIIRNTSKSDNRFNEVTITEKGRKLASDTREMFDRLDKAMFCDITDKELLILDGCFEKMKNGVNDFFAQKGEENR